MTFSDARASVITMVHPGLRTWNIVIAAAAAAVLMIEGNVRATGGMAPGDYLLAVTAAVPLVWTTRLPLAALLLVGFGGLLCDAAFDAGRTASGMVIIALYNVALSGGRQRSLAVGTLTAIVAIAGILLIDGTVDLQAVAIRVPLVFLSMAVGDTIRSRRALRASAFERAERDAHEREAEHRRRIADERLWIARELHDALAHSPVAINVQAGVAVDRGGSQDSSAALEVIKRASATALRDLRGTLSLLRGHGDDAPTAPAYDLDALPTLVAHARSAGLRTELDVQLGGAPVPSAVSVAAYRIVAEAVSSLLRNADASNAHVRVRTISDALDIEIIDDAQPNAASANVGPGLRGMAERAEALGGRLEVGPDKDGGWRVNAVLPLR
jgi:signal transduction histidine kinase